MGLWGIWKLELLGGNHFSRYTDCEFSLVRLWTTALTLEGRELCGILNAFGTQTTLACRGEGVLRHGFDPLVQQVRRLLQAVPVLTTE